MDQLFLFFKKYAQIVKYLIAGSFVFALNLALLYLFTEVFSIHYLVSNFLAFLIAFCVSFLLQKFWTFADHSLDYLHVQIPFFLAMQVGNISLNSLLMYAFVEYLHVWYLLAQAIISACLAVGIFLINKFYIFKQRTQ